MHPQDPLDPAPDDETGFPPLEVNPYRGPEVIAEPAEPAEPVSRHYYGQPRRWWTTLAIPAISLFVFIATSGLMLVVSLAVVHGQLDPMLLRDPDAYREVSRSRLGLFLVVVIPQGAMLLPPLVAALLSPTPTLRRLGLVRGHWPLWGWVAAACATPLVGLVSSLVIGMLVEESDNLKMMSEVFRAHGQSGWLIPLSLMIGATPAICEELLFRGYIQTRLTRTVGPALGIFLSSLLFAAFHMDWVHIVAVFPLGLFLGYVTWRSGSLYPAILGHFINNVTSVIAVVYAPQGETDVFALPIAMISLSVMGTGIIGLVAVIVLSFACGPPPNEPA